MKRLYAIFALLILIPRVVTAGFADSQVTLHPRLPATNPFIIEVTGIWPTDCHPGEQKPLIESYDGYRVEIGFEIIIEHVTCNSTDTPYRVLVDMSESVLTLPPLLDVLNVSMSFQGEALERELDLACPQDETCVQPAWDYQRAEPGLYDNPLLINQGLLIARQNDAMGVFPLVYSELGRSQWLFSGDHMVEDTFFTEIKLPSGGDCFGCEPTNVDPELTTIGRLSVLVDKPGILQVKINDGLFNEYHRTVYGYSIFHVGTTGEHTLIDLEGRWGISANWGTNPPAGDLTEFIPGTFDLVLEDRPASGGPAPASSQVSYLLSTPAGDILGQLVCSGQTTTDGSTSACEFIDPTDAAEPLLWFYQEGPSSLLIEFGRPLPDIGIAPGGKAVRID